MPKKMSKEFKDFINSQIEIEGFDYAMTEKTSPDDWVEGVIPNDFKTAWNEWMAAKKNFKDICKAYGIDPQ